MGDHSYTFEYDFADNIIKKSSSSYSYDQLNQLTFALLDGAFEIDVNEVDQNIGTADRDYNSQHSVNFALSETKIALDYNSVSLGVDLGKSYKVSKIEINPEMNVYRDLEGKLDILVNENNDDKDWTTINRDDWLLEQDQNGRYVIYFRVPIKGRYIKVHNYYDDRNYEDYPIWAESTIKRENNADGDVYDFFKVFYMETTKTEEYEYDDNGNRLELTETIAGVETVTNNTYVRRSGNNTDRIESSGPITFSYDDNGNMTGKVDSEAGDSWQYDYDPLNRLVSVQKNDILLVSYIYNHQGYRMKTESTEYRTTYYTFTENGNILYEEHEEKIIDFVYAFGKHLAKKEYGPGEKSEQETFYYLTDHLGSTVFITDDEGKVFWQDDFTPFGNTTGDVGTKHETGLFTGKQVDPDTSLYYSNARWYDSSLGRFITKDPIKDGLNWYGYVGNNPINFIDPSGLAYTGYTGASRPNYKPEYGGDPSHDFVDEELDIVEVNCKRRDGTRLYTDIDLSVIRKQQMQKNMKNITEQINSGNFTDEEVQKLHFRYKYAENEKLKTVELSLWLIKKDITSVEEYWSDEEWSNSAAMKTRVGQYWGATKGFSNILNQNINKNFPGLSRFQFYLENKLIEGPIGIAGMSQFTLSAANLSSVLSSNLKIYSDNRKPPQRLAPDRNISGKTTAEIANELGYDLSTLKDGLGGIEKGRAVMSVLNDSLKAQGVPASVRVEILSKLYLR